MQFHQKYGYQSPSLAILHQLEVQTGNKAMADKYQKLLKKQ
ncbi:hypothetical protein JCM19239_3259 [Vibrio variabilis]|uniref:Uncharacterized protein n=1 Tax=Vibrio variabilis TaxID=990271 RepID=A0ABQ0JFW1_9VIBR|nr:hypothetical protein JCM19239_3259 [Vibrio variabilis]